MREWLLSCVTNYENFLKFLPRPLTLPAIMGSRLGMDASRTRGLESEGISFMHEHSPLEVTRLLSALGNGESDCSAQLLAFMYEELHRIARGKMAAEQRHLLMQTSSLVHDAYMRILGSGEIKWECRAHFFGAAAEAMRRILIERVRHDRTIKHGGGLGRVPLDSESLVDFSSSSRERVDLLALDEALARLEATDERKAAITKLRFFALMTADEIADALNISRSTVEREWTAARAWLYCQLNGPDACNGKNGHNRESNGTAHAS
jgi:RNA polymerase sigma factor (TIGR02999 family)